MAAASTRATLGSGSMLGIMNVLMQLRKVRHIYFSMYSCIRVCVCVYMFMLGIMHVRHATAHGDIYIYQYVFMYSYVCVRFYTCSCSES